VAHTGLSNWSGYSCRRKRRTGAIPISAGCSRNIQKGQMKNIIWVLAVLCAFVAGFYVSANSVSAKYREEIVRLKGESSIYKAESEKYAQTIRSIRETAAQATVTEKAL